MKKFTSVVFFFLVFGLFAEDVANVKEQELIIKPIIVSEEKEKEVKQLETPKETAVVQKVIDRGTKTYMLRYRDSRASKDAFVPFANRKAMYEYIEDHNIRKNPNILSYKIVITKIYTDRKILFIEESKR